MRTEGGQVGDGTRRRSWLVYGGLLATTAGWLGAIVAAPLFAARGNVTAALTLYQAFSVICHQLPARSFHLHGFPLGVCSRCTGIYAGFAVGLLIYPLVRDLREERFPPRWNLLAAALPMTVDFALGWLELIDNTFLSRSLTGGLFGAVAAFYILPGLVATFCDRSAARVPTSSFPTFPRRT